MSNIITYTLKGEGPNTGSNSYFYWCLKNLQKLYPYTPSGDTILPNKVKIFRLHFIDKNWTFYLYQGLIFNSLNHTHKLIRVNKTYPWYFWLESDLDKKRNYNIPYFMISTFI